jgi:hypothetical protein
MVIDASEDEGQQWEGDAVARAASSGSVHPAMEIKDRERGGGKAVTARFPGTDDLSITQP